MKSITKCFLFTMQDKASDIVKRMNDYNPALDNVQPVQLDESLSVIKKRFSYSLKNKILNELMTKEIQPILNPRILIPSCIPSYLVHNPSTKQIQALVNLTPYGSKNASGEIYIDNRQLFALLQSGTITIGCFKNWKSITMNQNILKLGSSMYARMAYRILDSMFALSRDNIKSDKLMYILAKFFLVNILEKSTSEATNNIAYSVCSNGTTKATIMEFDSYFEDKDFENINEFIEALAENLQGLESLKFRTFLNSYIKMYGPSAIMSLEYFPAFAFTLTSAYIGAHLNAEYVIVNLFEKDLDKFYNDLSNILK